MFKGLSEVVTSVQSLFLFHDSLTPLDVELPLDRASDRTRPLINRSVPLGGHYPAGACGGQASLARLEHQVPRVAPGLKEVKVCVLSVIMESAFFAIY